MKMDHQQELWHETLEDALHDLVSALGGPKKVAMELWGNGKTPAEAARHLNHCLDTERAEKLSLTELLYLLRRGRETGNHMAMKFIGQDAGYVSHPIEPETEAEELKRHFIQAQQDMMRMLSRLEKLEQRKEMKVV